MKLKRDVALLVCVFAAVAVLGAEDQDKPAAAGATAPAAGGVVVFKDPVTGKIRQPKPGEVRALLQKAPMSKAKVLRKAGIRKQGGARRGVAITLPESSMVSMTVTRGPDGKLSAECVTGGQKAALARSATRAPASGAADTREASHER